MGPLISRGHRDKVLAVHIRHGAVVDDAGTVFGQAGNDPLDVTIPSHPLSRTARATFAAMSG